MKLVVIIKYVDTVLVGGTRDCPKFIDKCFRINEITFPIEGVSDMIHSGVRDDAKAVLIVVVGKRCLSHF